MDLEATIIALERSLHDPAIRADRAAVEQLLSPEFLEFGASGQVWSRERMLQFMTVEAPVSIASHDFVCKELAAGVILLTYTSSTSTRRCLRSSIWRLEGETWRLIFHQGTPIP